MSSTAHIPPVDDSLSAALLRLSAATRTYIQIAGEAAPLLAHPPSDHLIWSVRFELAASSVTLICKLY